MKLTEEEYRGLQAKVKALNDQIAAARPKTLQPEPMHGDPVLAAATLIKSFGLVAPGSHSVYVQRKTDPTGMSAVCLKVHLNPKHADSQKINVPTQWQGFPVELEDWPKGPNEVYQGG